MPRIARTVALGYPHHVTQRGNYQQSDFDDEARGVLVEVINTLKTTTTILILTHEDLPSLAVDQVYNLVSVNGTFVREQEGEF